MMKSNFLSILVLYIFLGCTAQNVIDEKSEGTGQTLWGSSIQKLSTEDRATTYKKIEESFGPLEVVRVYCESEKDKKILWPEWLPQNKNAVISFKLQPSEILSGRSDKVLADFFNSLPANKKIYWSYFHEPEDDVKRGEFSGADYRNAFDYIIRFKNSLKKQNAISTVILMTWTLKPEANMNWKDFLPPLVEVVAWDGYHRGWPDIASEEIFEPARKATLEIGKPWAVAEVGVNRHNKKDAQGNITVMDIARRKKLLTDMSRYLNTVSPKPVFVLYFNSIGANNISEYDWVIWDKPELVQAWKAGRN